MKKKGEPLAAKDLCKVKIGPLAKKYGCSAGYVKMVLNGTRSGYSCLARMVLKDAQDIVSIYGRDTSEIIDW